MKQPKLNLIDKDKYIRKYSGEGVTFDFPVWQKVLAQIFMDGKTTISALAKRLNVTYSHTAQVVHQLLDADYLTSERKGRNLFLKTTGSGNHVAMHCQEIREWVMPE